MAKRRKPRKNSSENPNCGCTCIVGGLFLFLAGYAIRFVVEKMIYWLMDLPSYVSICIGVFLLLIFGLSEVLYLHIKAQKDEQILPQILPSPNENDRMRTLEYADTLDGHQFEYWCADLLQQSGFHAVHVTKGSGDQGVDITAEKDLIKYAIQCKRYTKNVGNKPVQEVVAGRVVYNCNLGVVMTNQYFTEGAKKLASANNVELWDRNVLQRMLSVIQKKEKEKIEAREIIKQQKMQEKKATTRKKWLLNLTERIDEIKARLKSSQEDEFDSQKAVEQERLRYERILADESKNAWRDDS